jgi:hypothetical protein
VPLDAGLSSPIILLPSGIRRLPSLDLISDATVRVTGTVSSAMRTIFSLSKRTGMDVPEGTNMLTCSLGSLRGKGACAKAGAVEMIGTIALPVMVNVSRVAVPDFKGLKLNMGKSPQL